MIAKTLGHYQISSQIGKGGMGEVYQAKDQKLGRDVAVKVLPDEFARDADRVARFQREAKVLASLNHPNIAAIYGLEESGGTNFLVLELVEGQTLAERIKAGPIPVEESLKLALQIAEALEAAHGKGVIHRDLKPANIKVTPEGKAKVLDFGLAKAYAGDRKEVNLSNSPTLSDAATQQGVILGTAAYMSPEQACGKAADRKSDVWTFGVVLYEMLTGRSLFAGESVSQTLARVLERQPDFSLLPPNLHPKIIELLQRCLVKEARDRCHDIADVRIDITKLLSDPDGVFVQSVEAMRYRTKLRTILPWAATSLILGLIIAGLAVWYLKPAPPRDPLPVARFGYELAGDQRFQYPAERNIAVSPDGCRLIYGTDKGLYLRSMNELDAHPIPGTTGAQNPFFSPDGQWIGYWSTVDKKIEKISINGGVPVPLTDAPSYGLMRWGADNMIVFGQPGKGIMRIPADGGTPELIIAADGREILSPQVLPDGRSVLFTRLMSIMQGEVVVKSIKSGVSKRLFLGDTAHYLPTGHIVYALGNDLFAIPFNPDKLEITGESFRVIEGIYRESAAPQYAVSDSGSLVYIAGYSTIYKRTLAWVDRNGREELLEAEPKDYLDSRLSPDGTQLALTTSGDIWVWDIVRKNLRRFTMDGPDNYAPLWTSDGKRIIYGSLRGANSGIYWKVADGAGESELLCSSSGFRLIPYSLSRDGKILFLVEASPTGTKVIISALSMEGRRKRQNLLQDRYAQRHPQISPDGRLLAYSSDESGKEEVYVCPYPNVNEARKLVSKSGGSSPLWSPDGRELYYQGRDAVMVVEIETKPIVSVGTPRILFQTTDFATRSLGTIWSVSPDGKRFMVIKQPKSSAESPRKINVVLNWFEELKQRVQAK